MEYYQSYAQQEGPAGEWMQYAAESVDDIVYSLTDNNEKRIGAGTTLLSVVIHEDSLNWISVGDSRLYIFRGNDLVQVTNDHNYFYRLNQQKQAGMITAEEYHSKAHEGEALISFIGMGGLTLMDVTDDPVQLLSGDVILLCTDGFYRTITDEEINIILNESLQMQEASDYFEKLIEYRASVYQDIRNGGAYLVVDRGQKRANKKALEATHRDHVLLEFPSCKSDSNTCLIHKPPKTDAGNRKIWIPDYVAKLLRQWQSRQMDIKRVLGSEYQDYGLVVAQDNGRPWEDASVRKAFYSLQERMDLPHVTFHSLRHSSTTYKLLYH